MPKKKKRRRKKKPPMQFCDYCGKTKPDVRRRPDLYAEDVEDKKGATHIACNACDQECTDSI